jgi:hypothetical protein
MRNPRLSSKPLEAMNAPMIISMLIQSMEGSHGIGYPIAHASSASIMGPSGHIDELQATTSHELSAVLQDPERQRILNILRQARYNIHDSQIFSSETLNSLPKWSDIVELYGETPRIVGLESCERYRQQVVDPSMRTIGVAGMFNSGTNVLHFSELRIMMWKPMMWASCTCLTQILCCYRYSLVLVANCINRAAKDSTGVLWQG